MESRRSQCRVAAVRVNGGLRSRKVIKQTWELASHTLSPGSLFVPGPLPQALVEKKLELNFRMNAFDSTGFSWRVLRTPRLASMKSISGWHPSKKQIFKSYLAVRAGPQNLIM